MPGGFRARQRFTHNNRSRQRNNVTNNSEMSSSSLKLRKRNLFLIWLLLIVIAVLIISFIYLWPTHTMKKISNTHGRADMIIRRPNVLKTYNHDTTAFLQGLEFDQRNTEEDLMWESTGMYKQSLLRLWSLSSSSIIQEIKLEDSLFGEGLTIINNEILVLTWIEHVVLVYDVDTLVEKRRMYLKGQGWGIAATSSTQVAVSNGTSWITFYDAATMTQQRTVQVKFNDETVVKNLNELEYIDERLYANIWFEHIIVIINPLDGYIDKVLLLDHIVHSTLNFTIINREAVLNGIAYDTRTKRLFISGKNWPKLYEIECL